MMRRMLMTLGAGLLAACVQAQAIHVGDAIETGMVQGGPESPEMLGRLVGRWVLTGVIAGQNTVHDVNAAWVLQGNYVRIDEVSRERDENGRPAYEATIYVGWLESADRYVCIWLDNTEVASGEVTCSAAPTPDAIPFEFRDAQGALVFLNTFTYGRADDTWEWRMDNIQDGEAAPFGTVTLRRR